MGLFLGLDCSTQSLSAIVIDFDRKKVVFEASINFEKTLPQYKTIAGTLRHSDPLIVHSPQLMWLEALDLIFQEMKGIDLKKIQAISGSAQQHGSVYLNGSFLERLQKLSPQKSLKEQLEGAFSRSTSPIWMDASTSEECREIRESLGGVKKAVEMTGSDLIERFTASQIRKFYKQESKAYAQTASIALVSSFMASILAGQIAPIDYGDGSGMNLMDIRKKEWHPLALKSTAPDLEKKLPSLSETSKVFGTVHPYFASKYGINPDALVLPWTGDNPSSLIGLGLVEEGIVGISVGTSFTHFGTLKQFHVDPAGEGNLFVSPTGDYMPLNCFLNGALAIQKLRNQYKIDWEDFDKALLSTKPGKGILLPYFDQEIVPKVLKPGIRRFDLDPNDVAANCRAIVESQMLSMRLHSAWMKLHPTLIYATGGVSNRIPILQIMADVHNCPVLRSSVPKSTALGAALTAARASHPDKSWKEVISPFTAPLPPQINPNPHSSKHYALLLKKYEECENSK